MDRREARAIAREFRSLYKVADDLDRRLAAMVMTGKVAEIDGDRVRLEILPTDGRTGKAFLSPWVQVQEAAGQTGTHFPVKVGDPMRLMSPNGELGSQSLAIRDGYTADASNPAGNKQGELVIAHDGPIRIKGSSIVLQADSIENETPLLTNNGVPVGDDHEHTDTMPGSGLSGPPKR